MEAACTADYGPRLRSADVGEGGATRSPFLFDPWLLCHHPAARALGDNLLHAYDRLMPPRKRRMKDRDRDNLETTLRSILSNLAYAVATNAQPATVGISLRTARQKQTRYDRAAFGNLPSVLEVFSGTAFTFQRSKQRGIASAVSLVPDLKATLSRFRFKPEHFAQVPGREVVCLSRNTKNYVEHTTVREMVDYQETPETQRYRQEVERINGFVNAG